MSKSRFSGCLVGQCLGDALGFPVEGFPPDFCRRYVAETLPPAGTGVEGRGPVKFGQYTDDSQLARELMQSYVACRRFDPADYAKRIAAIFAEDRVVGRGRATHRAATRLAEGVPWQRAGEPAPSAGNGSAMRAAPIGLFFFDRPAELVRAAVDQGRMTHADPRCSAGAVAIAGCVAMAVARESSPREWPRLLGDRVAEVDRSFARYIRELSRWVVLRPEDAFSSISRCGVESRSRDDREGISPFVVGSVLWSLFSFLRSPDDYLETIRTAVAVGGDVDTTAAMAGAISGAYLGIERIPDGLARRVTDQGTWGYGDLVELAHRCYELKCGESGRRDGPADGTGAGRR